MMLHRFATKANQMIALVERTRFSVEAPSASQASAFDPLPSARAGCPCFPNPKTRSFQRLELKSSFLHLPSSALILTLWGLMPWAVMMWASKPWAPLPWAPKPWALLPWAPKSPWAFLPWAALAGWMPWGLGL